MNRLLVAGALVGLAHTSGALAAPTLEELNEILIAQQEQIDALNSNRGSSNTHVGGYGELHVNLNKDGDDTVDFHRFVLFVGHDFSPKFRFRSELEVEHAFSGDGAPGEVELEQAYVEYDLAPGSSARAGVILIPVGIINETHEPPTFYGVERNRVESLILPGTWWEAGAAYSHSLADTGISYDIAVHSGLSTDLTGSKPIRSGRQKVAEATANDWAATARIRYHGVVGLQLAASLQYQQDMSQQANDGIDDATLFTTHAIYNRGIFGVRALYAQWDIQGATAESLQRDRIYGWYIEPQLRANECWGVFARYSALEQTRNEEETNLVAGLNYWPITNVVFKADYTVRENPNNSKDKSVNLGMGYQF